MAFSSPVRRTTTYGPAHAVADIANQYHSSASRHFNNTLGRQNRAFMDEVVVVICAAQEGRQRELTQRRFSRGKEQLVEIQVSTPFANRLIDGGDDTAGDSAQRDRKLRCSAHHV